MEKLFYAGCSHVLVKADKRDKTIVYLEASSETPDSDEEIVLQKALEEEAESYLKKGVLSWDHQHKIKNDPTYIIGEPLDVKFSNTNEINTTLVKGRLYQKNKYAMAIMNMLSSKSTRLGASIGGMVIAKSEAYNKSIDKTLPVIEKVKWDEVAITYKPVNSDTRGKVTYTMFEEFGKSFFFKENLDKALQAGAGVNAASFTGGRVLVPESIGTVVKTKEFWVDLLTAMKNNVVVDFKSLRKYLDKVGIDSSIGINVVAGAVIDHINKIKNK